MERARDHAVVIGSGIAGLLSARVLSEHYGAVTVVDRDRFPPTPGHRPGVPQSHHVHGLQPRGAEIIDELFPELRQRLLDRGATVVDRADRVRIVTSEGVLPLDGVTGRGALLVSRSLLEWQLHDSVCRQASIQMQGGVEVVGLAADRAGHGVGDRPRVHGVRIRRRPDAAADRARGETATDVMSADLVVDASGRRSRLPEWLDRIGVGPVPEETLTSGMSYASRFYEGSDDVPCDSSLVLVLGRPPHSPRVGLFQQIENGRWHISLAGLNGQEAPTDDAGFLRWARELPDPALYEAIQVARPAGPIRGWRTPTSRWRHVERLAAWPAGLIALGDAVCAFNPCYGQGMSVAAMEALVLQECLRDDARGTLEERFQRRLARTVADPWLIAGSDELQWPNVRLTGAHPPPGLPVARRYLALLLKAAMKDPALAARYFAVLGMQSSPRSLAAPPVLARVLRGSLVRAGGAMRSARGP